VRYKNIENCDPNFGGEEHCDPNFGGEFWWKSEGLEVKINFTNTFPHSKNQYGDGFVRRNEYVSKIKNIENSDPNFRGRGGQKN